jgi:hypothetical protein
VKSDSLLLNDFGDEFAGSGCVPVFEFDISDLHTFVERAKALGAKVVLDALNIETMQSVVLSDSEGHEFELCSCHNSLLSSAGTGRLASATDVDRLTTRMEPVKHAGLAALGQLESTLRDLREFPGLT